MKLRILALLAVLLSPLAVAAQSAVLGKCWYAGGSAWVTIHAVAASGPAATAAPASFALYGLNGSTYYPLACDADGNLIVSGGSYTLPIATTTVLGGIKPDGTTIAVDGSTGVASVISSSGPRQTCDASTVSNYAPAVCVFTLTAADLAQFDGTAATAIAIVSAPGSGKVIVPEFSTVTADSPASTVPFDLTGDLRALIGTYNFGSSWLFNVPFELQSQFMIAPAVYGYGGSVSQMADGAFSIYDSMNLGTTGGIATSALNPGGAADGVNTSQITSGHAGLLYSIGDTPALSCGATFYVDSVDGVTGAVLTYHETASGAGGGCTTGVGQATTGGGDGNLQLDVLTVGAAYRVSDTFQVAGGCNISPTGHVTAVDGNGLITTYALDTLGIGCFVSTGNTLSTTTGIGSGAAIDITSITPPNSTVILTVPYTVQPVQ